MYRESFGIKKLRAKKIIAALDRTYPDARFGFTSGHFLLGCFHEWHRFHGG
jgi:hypothetical protein